MDIQNYLCNLYGEVNNLIKTDLGLSNDIYTFEYHDVKYCLRHSTNPAINKDNLKLERLIQKELINSNMDFNEVYYDEDNGVRITYFVDDLKTLKQETSSDKYSLIIKRIKEFHKLSIKTNIHFDLRNKYLSYRKRIKNSFIDYKQYESILNDYEKLNLPICLCHNDLVDGNILYKDDNCFLIDYEFASLNYELFDLASLISENPSISENDKELIINEYFNNNVSNKDIRNINTILKAQNLLWATWANMMFDIYELDIYKTIFNDKLKALNN